MHQVIHAVEAGLLLFTEGAIDEAGDHELLLQLVGAEPVELAQQPFELMVVLRDGRCLRLEAGRQEPANLVAQDGIFVVLHHCFLHCARLAAGRFRRF